MYIGSIMDCALLKFWQYDQYNIFEIVSEFRVKRIKSKTCLSQSPNPSVQLENGQHVNSVGRDFTQDEPPPLSQHL